MQNTENSWRKSLLIAGLMLPPLVAILVDLSSGPLRAFTVLPYLFATLGCYWTGSSKSLLAISGGSLILLTLGTFAKGSDQILFYVNRATFGATLLACAFITHRAIQSRQNLVQQSLAQVLEDLDAGLAIFGKKETLIFSNTAFNNILPKKDNDMTFIEAVERLSSEPLQRNQSQLWLAQRQSRDLPSSAPLELRFSDGRHFQLYVQDLEMGQTMILHDISSLKSYQAQAIQASKLALLGELSASLAHEISQPLGAIELTTDNIELHLEQAQGEVNKDYLASKLQRTRNAAQKARKIIDHLRRFGRNAKEDPTPVDLCGVLYSAADLMQDQFKKSNIGLAVSLPDQTTFVMGHPIQLEQVFLNLLANARDAVAEHVSDPRVSVTLAVEGDLVTVSVADNGPGVPDAIQRDIFDAFYTTKAMGTGTGLGLSVSRGIIADLEGDLTLSSSRDGAIFNITLPVSRGVATAA
jgi:signal transduction histidine kinase